MKKRNRYGAIAALTLGLCLVTTAAFAADYQVINSSGESIQAKCSGNSSYTDIANGSTADFLCTGNSMHVRVAGGSDPDTISFRCRGKDTAKITVNMGSNGNLTYTTSCSSA